MALFCVVFAVWLASGVLHDPICCGDDAYFATTARNLAIGVGYAASYPRHVERRGEIRPFDPGVTVGPPLVVATAAAIGAFGNQYWVPGATTALLIVLLLASLAVAWRPLFESEPRALAAAALFVATALLATTRNLDLWSTMLGEIPAALFVGLAVAIAARRGPSFGTALATGLLFGLAASTKMVSWLAAPAPALVLAHGAWRSAADPLDRLRGLARVALAFAAGSLAPLATFELCKAVELGQFDYLALKSEELRLLRTHPGNATPGIAPGSRLAGIAARIARNAEALSTALGSAWAAAALGLAALAIAVAALRRARPNDRFAAAMMLAFAVHAGWWITSSGGWFRHLLPAFLYLALAVAAWLPGGRPLSLRIIVVALLALALSSRIEALPGALVRRPAFAPAWRAAAMLDTRDFLAALPSPRVLVADWWGSAADLEYLLPGHANFVATWLFEEADHPHAWIVRNEYMLAERFHRGASGRLDAAIAACNAQRVFHRRPYSVYACAGTPAPESPDDADPLRPTDTAP